MPVTKHSYINTLSQIDELKDERSDLREILECYKAIFKAQNKTQESFHPDFDGLDLSYCKKRTSNNVSFLNSKNIRIQWDIFDDLLNQICKITKNLSGSEEADTEDSWSSLSDKNTKWHETLLKGFLEDASLLNKLAEQTGISLNMLTFITGKTLTPFMEKYAEKLREYIDSTLWFKGSCPVCGGEPLMGRLEKEAGKKYLQCYLCRTNWDFARLECSFCGNTDQEKLRYFFDEEDNVHRVEVCDQCKTYLKIVDIRNTENDVVVVVENLATLHLDLVAKREGFTRDTNKLFGL